jgi:hypothetical protein
VKLLAGVLLGVAAFISAFLLTAMWPAAKPAPIALSDLVGRIDRGQITKVEFTDRQIVATDRDRHRLGATGRFHDPDVMAHAMRRGDVKIVIFSGVEFPTEDGPAAGARAPLNQGAEAPPTR